ncbi:MAG: ribbon-helix-helix protein, CopG family [Halanaerobiales bacterium]
MAETVDKLVRLEKEQKIFLENKSAETNLSENEIIRRAINDYITKDK